MISGWSIRGNCDCCYVSLIGRCWPNQGRTERTDATESGLKVSGALSDVFNSSRPPVVPAKRFFLTILLSIAELDRWSPPSGCRSPARSTHAERAMTGTGYCKRYLRSCRYCMYQHIKLRNVARCNLFCDVTRSDET